MHHSRYLLLSLIIIPILMAFPQSVTAFPPLPSSFYGIVKFNNSNLPDGTTVEAIINDQIVASGYTQTYQDESVYALDVPGDDSGTTIVEGGKEGDVIHFKVGGIEVTETGIWHSGTNVELAFMIDSSAKLETPQPTRTPHPSQTAIVIMPSSPTPTLEASVDSIIQEDSSIIETEIFDECCNFS